MTYEILHAYGCAALLDPAKEYIPKEWYGACYAISAHPAILVCLHK